MTDLSFRFDPLTEEVYARRLGQLRELAQAVEFPERVTVEVGSNRANFLAQLSLRHPERYFVGIEWRYKFVEMGRELLESKSVTNAMLVWADANLALPILFDDGQIDEMFILFPDPWWKVRHHKRRIIQPEFLDLLSRKMAPDGKLWIRTDVGPLADSMREILDAHPAFEIMAIEDYPLESFPRTTREVKIVAKGLPVHLLYYRHMIPAEEAPPT